MKKFAATFLLTGILAVAGFAGPATAASDKNNNSKGTAETTSWWPK